MKIILFLVCLFVSVYPINTSIEAVNKLEMHTIKTSKKLIQVSVDGRQMRILQTQGNTTNQDQPKNNTQNNTKNNTQNKQQNNTGNQQVPEKQCQKECSTLSYYSCSVCYDKCTIKSKDSTTFTFTMTSCSHTVCKKYKTEAKDEQDPTSTVTQCSEWQTENLAQAQCTQTCCNKPNYSKFDIYTWFSCVDVNMSRTKTFNLVSLIVGSVLGGGLVLIILIIILCCYKERIAIACKNCCWCFESCFTGKYVTKAMKTKQSETKDTRQAPDSQTNDGGSANNLNRSSLKWTKIKMKKQARQLTSSKYIIQSQYDINPQIYCPICLDDMLNCKTACDHNFHFQCLRMSLKKKFKCPQCDSKKVSPVKIMCEECRQNETLYEINKKNINTKYPNFYYENKIICDQCLNDKIGYGSREQI